MDFASAADLAVKLAAKVTCQEEGCDPAQLDQNTRVVNDAQFRTAYADSDNCKSPDSASKAVPMGHVQVPSNQIYINGEKIRQSTQNPVASLFGVAAHEYLHKLAVFKPATDKEFMQYALPSGEPINIVGYKGLVPYYNNTKESLPGKQCLQPADTIGLKAEEGTVELETVATIKKYGLGIKSTGYGDIADAYESGILSKFHNGYKVSLYLFQRQTEPEKFYGEIGRDTTRSPSGLITTDDIVTGRRLVEAVFQNLPLGPQE